MRKKEVTKGMLDIQSRLEAMAAEPTPDSHESWPRLVPLLPAWSPGLRGWMRRRFRRPVIVALAAAVIALPAVAYASSGWFRHGVDHLVRDISGTTNELETTPASPTPAPSSDDRHETPSGRTEDEEPLGTPGETHETQDSRSGDDSLQPTASSSDDHGSDSTPTPSVNPTSLDRSGSSGEGEPQPLSASPSSGDGGPEPSPSS